MNSQARTCMSKKKKKKKSSGEDKDVSEIKKQDRLATTAETDSGKVIDHGDAKLIVSGVAKSDEKGAEPREISVQPRVIEPIEPIEPEEPELVKDSEEDVVRLESLSSPGDDRIKVDKAKFDKLEKRTDDAIKEEEKWGGKITTGWWITIAGGCAAVILVGALLLKTYQDGDSIETLNPGVEPLDLREDLFAESPQKWFRDNDVKLRKQAIELLGQYIAANNIKARSKLVRDPEAYLENADSWPVVFEPRAVDDEHCKWSISDTGGLAYLLLKGRDAEFMPMRAFFVRDTENDSIKLDWHATVGWSKISMKDMKSKLTKRQLQIDQIKLDHEIASRKSRPNSVANPNKSEVEELTEKSPMPDFPEQLYSDPVDMRCLLTRRNEHYIGPYNEGDHSAFMLRSPDRLTYMWGYVARDSPLDQELRRLLDHGRFVVSLKKDHPVILRVRRSEKDALPSQLDLLELVQPEWVTP